MDAADRRDEALLADFWYPDARAGAFGVRWVEKLRAFSPTTAPARSTSANSPAQGVRPEPLRLFSCRQLGFYPPHGHGPPAPERSGAIVLRGNGNAPAYRALDRSAVRRGRVSGIPTCLRRGRGDTAAWFPNGTGVGSRFSVDRSYASVPETYPAPAGDCSTSRRRSAETSLPSLRASPPAAGSTHFFSAASIAWL